MKIKIGIIILATICVGLLIALFATKKAADDQRGHDHAAILDFSNQLISASTTLDDLRQVNLMLTNDLATVHEVMASLSNNLASTSSALDSTKSSLESAEGQITNLNGRISDLEAQNKALDERAVELTSKIAALDSLIAVTQQKLANAEANNSYLAAELQKQLAEKAELQRNYNDLNVVRAQVKKLRDELFITRRLQWMASGTDPSTPQKGGQLLMQRGSTSPSSAAAAKAAAKASSQYDLNVEVGSDGSIHVIPPPPSPEDNAAQAAARAVLLNGSATNAAAPSDAAH